MFKILLLVALSVAKPVPQDCESNNTDSQPASSYNNDDAQADPVSSYNNDNAQPVLESNIYNAQPNDAQAEPVSSYNNDNVQPVLESNIYNAQPNEEAEPVLTYNNENVQQGNDNAKSYPCLPWHKKVRNAIGIQPPTWDEELAQQARDYLEKNIESPFLKHSKYSGQGENLFSTKSNIDSCGAAMASWLAESKNYNGERIGDGNFNSYGHYTQIVYPKADKIGCAVKGHHAICKYNKIQEFGTIVKTYNGALPQ